MGEPSLQGIKATDRLDRLLAPLAWHLDGCWWYLGGADVSRMPDERVRDHLAAPPEQDRRAFEAECEDRAKLLGEYTEQAGESLVGRPGFFGRFAGQIDAPWETLFACEATACPTALLRGLRPLARDTAHRPSALPPEVCLMARNIDDVYWELYFRDDWMFWAVWDHVRPLRHVSRV